VVPIVQQRTGRHALSWLGVPIMMGDEAIGCISAQNFERERVFTDTDVRLLSTIAANMGIAITNAQLFAASQQRAAELDAALQASRSLTSSLDLTTVFDSILESAVGLMRQAETIDLFLYRDEKLIFARAASGSSKRKDIPWSEPRPNGITVTVAQTGEPVTVEDVTTDARFFAPGWTGAVLGLPLKIGARVVGVMNVAYPQPRIFSDSEQRALRLLGDQAAIAIENARLYDQSLQEIQERARAEEELLQANARLQSHIAEIEILQTQLREQAVRDPLTGLFNRRYLEETLDRELYRSEREGESVSVVMLDIDHFKAVNDTYGHKAGDLLLQALGHLLITQTRRGDVACRIGGEEFIIIMPGASLKAANQRAERWRQTFEHLDITDAGQRVQATLSIGIAIFPLHGRDSEAILRAADQAMYAAKDAGRNRVMVYSRPAAA
jgi:diguanylate cyclase (GGDEF)-like protein